MVRVAVLHNVDYEERTAEADPGFSARADVVTVASAVCDALRDEKHEPQSLPVDGDLQRLRETLAALQPDCVFNLCESLVGDARLESAVPILLELMRIPYTGSPPEAMCAALYKDRVKERLEAAGVRTPRACVMRTPDDAFTVSFPAIVKPTREDGSVGINGKSVVHDKRELRERVAALVGELGQPCLVEEYIEGRELNVALFGFPSARVLPLQEIDFSALPNGAPRIVTYDAKWRTGSTDDIGTRPVMLPSLPASVGARVRKVASAAFAAIGLRDYGRVDVRVDSAGTPYVIDVNPNCDLSPSAGLSRAAKAFGLDHTALVHLLVRYALMRKRGGAQKAPPRRIAR